MKHPSGLALAKPLLLIGVFIVSLGAGRAGVTLLWNRGAVQAKSYETFRMSLEDKIIRRDSSVVTVGAELAGLGRPVVLFIFRSSCVQCLADLVVVSSVSARDSIPVWPIWVASSDVDPTAPPLTKGLPLHEVATVSPEVVAAWGVSESPAIVEIDSQNRAIFFEEGTLAAAQYRAVKWRPTAEVFTDSTGPR
jgi:hypothetical protein